MFECKIYISDIKFGCVVCYSIFEMNYIVFLLSNLFEFE